jgi:glyoxylase-like metal-dependent hydrolase (beta-lactamase superfamily II)
MVDGIYRICNPPTRDAPISFNQFLIDDERPTLIHTGFYEAYDAVRAAVAEVLDPKQLAYVVLGHFEADECGGMDRFLVDAPGSVLVASELGAAVNLAHWGYRGAIKGMRDGDLLDVGRHRLRFLEAPHVHHWDSMMVFEETSSSLFPADLFIQPGEQPSVVVEDLTQAMLELYRISGIFAHEAPVSPGSRWLGRRLESGRFFRGLWRAVSERVSMRRAGPGRARTPPEAASVLICRAF